MTLADELGSINTIFIDTAPIIYYIEAHPQFGLLVREVVRAFQSGSLRAFSSVITLTEVLPKPIELGKEGLVKKFSEFLKHGKSLSPIEISVDIAEKAGKLRGRYPSSRALDAIQLAVALDVEADAFLTNDSKLKRVAEIKIIVLKDYI